MIDIVNIHNVILDKLSILELHIHQDNEIKQIKEQYLLGALPYISAYYNSVDIATRNNSAINYNFFIIAENIHGKLAKYLNQIPSIDLHNYSLINLQPCLDHINNADMEFCECGGEYIVRPKYSDLCCSTCGNLRRLVGTYFEPTDNQNKSSVYKPSRRCEQWVTCIFAAEKNKVPDEVINNIRACMRRDRVACTVKLSCGKIRDYLKEINSTQYNINVPQIRARITGIVPPQPLAHDYLRICQLFDIADDIYTKIIEKKDVKYGNRRYYPHFIRKIIEIVYIDRPQIKNLIIESIHVQERATTEKHDARWKEICDNSNGQIVFIKTKL